MTQVESPQTFVIREECAKAAWQHGYRVPLGEEAGWSGFRSTTAQGTIWLAASGQHGSWYLALDHAGVEAELGLPAVDIAGPGIARHAFADLGALYAVLMRQYQLAVSLPNAPLHEFMERTRDLPKTTEAERLVVQRVGQNIFRDRLLQYWQGRCPLTDIADQALLRASHIKPWRDCETDGERLDVHNGLLLSALWDAAFDAGLVTFNDDGSPEFSVHLSSEARSSLYFRERLSLTQKHKEFLEWHRAMVFRSQG